MKIYTSITLVWDPDTQTFIEESSESYEYAGDVIEAKGGGTNTVKEKAEPWEAQQPYLKKLFGDTDQAYQQDKNTRDSSGSRGALEDYITSVQQANPQLESLTNQAIQTNEGVLANATDPTANPHFQDYLNLSNKAITDSFTQNVLPNMTSGAAAVGNIGSSRQGVMEALTSKNLMDTLQRNTAQMSNSAYNSGLQAQTQALALAPQTGQMGFLPSQGRAKELAGQEQLEGFDYNRDIARLKDYQSLIGGGYGGSSTQEIPYESGGLTGALGGASAGGGIATALGASTGWGAAIVGAGALLGYMS